MNKDIFKKKLRYGDNYCEVHDIVHTRPFVIEEVRDNCNKCLHPLRELIKQEDGKYNPRWKVEGLPCPTKKENKNGKV